MLYIVGPGARVAPHKARFLNVLLHGVLHCCVTQVCALCGGGCEWDVWCWSGGNDQPS